VFLNLKILIKVWIKIFPWITLFFKNQSK